MAYGSSLSVRDGAKHIPMSTLSKHINGFFSSKRNFLFIQKPDHCEAELELSTLIKISGE